MRFCALPFNLHLKKDPPFPIWGGVVNINIQKPFRKTWWVFPEGLLYIDIHHTASNRKRRVLFLFLIREGLPKKLNNTLTVCKTPPSWQKFPYFFGNPSLKLVTIGWSGFGHQGGQCDVEDIECHGRHGRPRHVNFFGQCKFLQI